MVAREAATANSSKKMEQQLDNMEQALDLRERHVGIKNRANLVAIMESNADEREKVRQGTSPSPKDPPEMEMENDINNSHDRPDPPGHSSFLTTSSSLTTSNTITTSFCQGCGSNSQQNNRNSTRNSRSNY